MTEYRQVKILVDSTLAAAYKDTCHTAGTSMAEDLSRHMAGCTGSAVARTQIRNKNRDMGTRGRRRKASMESVLLLETILDRESAYMERIPDNLQGGPAYESAEKTVSALEQAIELLNEAF